MFASRAANLISSQVSMGRKGYQNVSAHPLLNGCCQGEERGDSCGEEHEPIGLLSGSRPQRSWVTVSFSHMVTFFLEKVPLSRSL